MRSAARQHHPYSGNELEKILGKNATAADVTVSHTEIEELEALIKKYPNIAPVTGT